MANFAANSSAPPKGFYHKDRTRNDKLCLYSTFPKIEFRKYFTEGQQKITIESLEHACHQSRKREIVWHDSVMAAESGSEVHPVTGGAILRRHSLIKRETFFSVAIFLRVCQIEEGVVMTEVC